MWVVREVGGCYHVERGNIVDYYRDEFEDIDLDECAIDVVLFDQ